MSESQNNSILVSLDSKLYGSAVHNNSEDENKQSSEPFKFLSNPRIAVEIFIWGFYQQSNIFRGFGWVSRFNEVFLVGFLRFKLLSGVLLTHIFSGVLVGFLRFKTL